MAVDLVMVHDMRRLIAEGLGAVLDAHPDFSVVAVSTSSESTIEVPHGVTTVLTSSPGSFRLEQAAEVRLCAFSIDDPLSRIVSAIRNHSGNGEIGEIENRVPGAADDGVELTAREREIVLALADGLVSSQIGTELGITAKTVDNHKQRIFVKLGVQSQAHAVVRSRTLGLLDPSPRRRARR